MRSALYLAALLPLTNFGALANKPEKDEIVVVTAYRTVTVCPITELWTCTAEDDTPKPTTKVTTTTKTGVKPTTTHGHGGGDDDDDDDDDDHHGGGGHGGKPTTTTAATTDDGSNGGGNGPKPSTSHHWGNGTYTGPSSSGPYTEPDTTTSVPVNPTSVHPNPSTSGSPTTEGGPKGSTTGAPTTSGSPVGPGSSTTTSAPVAPGSSTTTSARSSSASSSSCTTGGTIKPLQTPECNTPTSRSKWCKDRSGNDHSVTDDTHELFFTGRTREYELVITSGTHNADGFTRASYLINGKTPGEAIVANWGDYVKITVTNLIPDNVTTIHWHGIRQLDTNDQDGVPGVSECAIPPLGSRTYTWHASTYGTGWYHSHALAQYGGGLRGPIIIHGPASADYDYDLGSVMLDEVFQQTIFQVGWNVARNRGPLPPSFNYLINGKNKSPDGTQGESTKFIVKPGKKHLFRIINSAAQSAFAVRFDNHKIKVISADFTPIKPYDTDVLWIQPGQRYNVILTADQNPGAYFLRAVSQTGCGASSTNTGLTGSSHGIFTYEGSCGTPVSDGFSIVTAGDCKDEPLAGLIPIVEKGAGSTEEFTESVKLLPGGSGTAQVFAPYGAVIRWLFGGPVDLSKNNATLLGTNTVTVNMTEPTLKTLATLPDLPYNSSRYSNAALLDGPAETWKYFVIQNNFQTSHPMHLHGHDFAVLGAGRGVFTTAQIGSLNFVNPIRRDTTLLVGLGSPTAYVSGWTVIGFPTDNPGAWLMHCHLIWHADGGMGLQFIERPDAIDATGYYDAGFKGECAALESYVASGKETHHSYEAGLKRDLAFHKHGHAHRHADLE